MKVKTVTFVI